VKLVAGVGNVLFGDDGFGVELVRALRDLPIDTRVVDFGIRAVHFAYELLATPDLLVVADCMTRGGQPGTLYVVEPADEPPALVDAHGMNLPLVFSTVRWLGGVVPRTLVVGCEPYALAPGIGLSPAVAGAIPEAVHLIRSLVQEAR
jgi:hydrogenase maturation protease